MTTHLERTATAPRHSGLHTVKLSHIQRVAPGVRLLTLSLPYAIKFLPGQWVDLHIPSLRSPGGFTIVSPPSDANYVGEPSNAAGAALEDARRSQAPSSPLRRPFIELAIQRTTNPPAQWLWRPLEDIIGSMLDIRIGGSFVWPPTGSDANQIGKVIFIAGGVGINPFVSMLSSMYESRETIPKCIDFLYSAKKAASLQDVLFLERLRKLFEAVETKSDNRYLTMFLTGDAKTTLPYAAHAQDNASSFFRLQEGRIEAKDLASTVKSLREDQRTVAYVCGPGDFVDGMVKIMSKDLGTENVFFEKWW